MAVAGCGDDGDAAGEPFTPAHDGTLTVATAVVPAPGFWDGGDDGPPTRGFEARLAQALADRFGLDDVSVVVVPFADIAGGDLGGADIALTQMTPTEERERDVDFTTPYLTTPPGVLVARDGEGAGARDAEDLQALRWVVVRSTTLAGVVEDRIRPDRTPVEVDDRPTALEQVSGGEADALLLDLAVAQGLAEDRALGFEVAGQLTGDEGLAVVLPEGSDNREAVDSAVRAFKADGTIDDLVDRWLGGDADDVPLIRVGD